MLEILLRVVVAVLLVAGGGGLARDASSAAAPDVDAYAASIQAPLGSLGDSAGAMAALMGAPAITSANWRAQAEASFDDVRAGHAALVAVQPPVGLEEVHALLTTATQHCSDGADAAQKSIEEGSALGLYAATQLLIRCADGIKEWGAALNALR